MELTDSELILSTGRKCYQNAGIIGLGQDFNVAYGYDGGLDVWGWGDEKEAWTKAERQELADYMIAAWQRFREADGPIDDEGE